MGTEAQLRLVVLILFALGLAASATLRRRADREGGTVPRSADGKPVMIAIGLAGGVFYASLAAWLIHPPWVAWAAVEIPVAGRWTGVALMAAGFSLGLWALWHLGRNVTPTSVARQGAGLVTSGPYRHVRHPLYSSMLLTIPGVGLASASLLIFGAGVATFGVILIRTRREERDLVRGFGDRYVRYMERTGRILPRFGTGEDPG